jgi:hypothetical protein
LLSGAVAGAVGIKEQTMPTAIESAPWNKVRFIGQKRPLKPKEVRAIRVRLQLEQHRRDLALFNLAIDSKLRGCDLVQLDYWFEHYNSMHPHNALGYRSPREYRKLLFEKTTDNAIGAMRRTHESTTAMEVIGSRPIAAPGAGARSASLDASTAMDHS